MKNIIIAITITALFTLLGCATSSYTYGNNFSSKNVSKIEKGKTTTNELISMFGQPFMKTVISKTGEKWVYSYSAGTASAQSYLVTTKVETTGTQKMLDILVENGVVSNYTFTEGPMPNSTIH